MRNKMISETQLIKNSIQVLQDRLPASWRLRSKIEPAVDRGGTSPDAVVDIAAPDGTKGHLLFEARSRLEARDVERVADRFLRNEAPANPASAVVVLAPFLTPRTRELLVGAGVSYADATGNMRISLQSPAVFVQADGADRDPWPVDRPLQSLRGRGAGRAVRALCDFRPPYGIRELGERAAVSPASLSRVVDLLEREAIIGRDEARGPVTKVDWPELLRRWTRDYSFSQSNWVAQYVEPRGFDQLAERLRSQKFFRYAATGSMAVPEDARVAPTRLAVLYVSDLDRAATKLKLAETDRGANVWLCEPFDRVVFDRTTVEDGLTRCGLSQVAADLLTGPGRSPEEGEALIRWMLRHEDAWRT